MVIRGKITCPLTRGVRFLEWPLIEILLHSSVFRSSVLGPAISAVFLEQLLYLSLLFAKQIYLSDMVDSECNGTGEISHYFAYQKSKLFAVDKIKYIISTKYIIRVSFFHTIRKWDPKNLGNLSLPVPSNPPMLPQLSSWTSRGIRKNLYLYLLINTCLFVFFFWK